MWHKCVYILYIYIYICKHRNRWYFLDLEPWTACFTLFSFPHFLRWIWTKSARWSFTRNAPWRRRPRASVCHPPVAVVFGSPSTGHVWHGDAPCVRWRMRRHRNPVPWSMVGVRIPDLSDVHLLTFVDLSLSFGFFWGFGLSLDWGWSWGFCIFARPGNLNDKVEVYLQTWGIWGAFSSQIGDRFGSAPAAADMFQCHFLANSWSKNLPWIQVQIPWEFRSKTIKTFKHLAPFHKWNMPFFHCHLSSTSGGLPRWCLFGCRFGHWRSLTVVAYGDRYSQCRGTRFKISTSRGGTGREFTLGNIFWND